MTWQRIDENTYIDATLVTCAEYQLFIDEMHEQGEYFQPDHWTSYQFPEGQAREPILGVRHSDARAFCEWLARQGQAGWRYYLPTLKYADKYAVKYKQQDLVGFWMDEDYQFSWVCQTPQNARKIEIDPNTDFELSVMFAFSRASNRPLNLSYISTDDPELGSTLYRIRDRSLATEREFEQALKLNLEYARKLHQTIDNSLEPASGFNRIFDGERNDDRRRKVSHNFEVINNRDSILNLYADLFTLQERIAGRSPAFEGIRLVKERIK